MNLVGTVYGIAAIFRPSRLIPSLTVDEFSDIPLDIAAALTKAKNQGQDTSQLLDIRALVVDKDNCFAEPYAQEVWPRYQKRWASIRQQFPGDRLLIVSNSSGTLDDAGGLEAKAIESRLETRVLIHSIKVSLILLCRSSVTEDFKKPACHSQVLQFLQDSHAKVTSASQVVVIGDRLFTDVLMANMMGAHSIWIRRGTVRNQGFLTRLEDAIYRYNSS